MSDVRPEPTDDRPGTLTKVILTRIELWMIRMVMLSVLGVLAWIGVQFKTALIHVAEIRKELSITKPADVLAAVNTLEKQTLTRQDVIGIINENKTPWELEREKWELWRLKTSRELQSLQNAVDANTNSIKIGTSDRLRKSEFQLWVEKHRRLNPQIKTPEF